MKPPVIVERYNNRPAAEAARCALKANGIEAFVIADDPIGRRLGPGFARGIDLLVEPEELARAKRVLGN